MRCARASTTPRRTRRSATRCAVSSLGRSSLSPRNGTRPRASRASSIARPRRSACSGWDSPRSMAASRATASSPSSPRRSWPAPARAASPRACRATPSARRKISALAITEPGAGSDVANLQTRARREGGHYVVNGSKTFITSGMRADYYTVAVRTGAPGKGGISLLVIERDTPGFTRSPLKKMGWWASDTATLYFDDCRVPVGHLLGEENQGFTLIMRNFNRERLGMAAGCAGYAQVCLDEAVAYARERETFGRKLIEHQVIRHKLVDMAMRINATQAYLESVAWRIGQGENAVADICLLKNQATQTMEFCAREAVQIFGGAGFMRGPKVERIYREVRVNAIGGGAEEIMRDLAARQLGY